MAEPLIGLDLFTLLVEYISGGILLSLFVWAIVLLITGIMGRMAIKSIMILIISYFVAVSVGYIGALAAVPIFIVASWYMVSNVLNWYYNTLR